MMMMMMASCYFVYTVLPVNHATGYASQHILCLSQARIKRELHHKSPEEIFFWHRLTRVVQKKGCKVVVCVYVCVCVCVWCLLFSVNVLTLSVGRQ